MTTSYNGWSAAPGWSVEGGQIAVLDVAGETFAPGVRSGDVHTVLGYVARQLHARVEPIVRADWHQADDWGYNYRPNTNNPSVLSCHASGTAIDYNATRHPNGKAGTWSEGQKAEILKILSEVNNVVRCLWGYDEMHFEICAGSAAVAAVASKIQAKADDSEDDMQDDERNAVISTHAAIYYAGGAQGDQSIIERLVEIQRNGRATLVKQDALSNALTDDEADILAALRASGTGNAQAVAEQLAPLLLAGGLVTRLTDEDLPRLAQVTADEIDRRNRERLEQKG